MHPLGQGDVAEPRIVLEQAEQFQVESVERDSCHLPASVPGMMRDYRVGDAVRHAESEDLARP
jgi:hypothetical protein